MPTLPKIVDWWTSLPTEWQFLFVLPFAVAAASLLAPWVDRRRKHAAEPRDH